LLYAKTGKSFRAPASVCGGRGVLLEKRGRLCRDF
jgi:hypothetical protein